MLTIKSQSVIYLGLKVYSTLLPKLFPDGVPCCNNIENILSDRTYLILAQTYQQYKYQYDDDDDIEYNNNIIIIIIQ